MRYSSVSALSLLLLAACQPEVPGSGTVSDAGISADSTDISTVDLPEPPPPPEYPTDDTAPTVTLTAPDSGAVTDTETIVVTGVADDDLGVAALTVQVGFNVPVPVAGPNADGSFAFDVALGAGTQSIVVRAYDIGGNVGQAAVEVTREMNTTGPDNPPTVTIEAPLEGFNVATSSVHVSGTADDDVGIATVEMIVDDGAPTLVQTGDHFATWYALANVFPQASGDNTITIRATDTAGNVTETTVTGSTTVVADATPPTVAITSPTEGFTTTDDSIEVTGTSGDDTAVASVDVRVDDGPYNTVVSNDSFATWTATVSLPPGEHVIKVRALDVGGISATDTVTVTNTSTDTWGPPQVINLEWVAPAYAASTFALDKQGLDDMMTDDVADQLVMLEVDVEPLVEAAIENIKAACGPAWPTVDVSGNCPTVWGQSEINMYRLVTMTPANVNVAGTSIQGMEDIASTLSTFGLLDSFNEILSDALAIPIDAPIVQTPAIVGAMRDNVLATHPNMLPGPAMPVTMLDALSDMTTLGAKFDAAGAHPGFVDAAAGTFSKVLLDTFEMTMVATSNLHWHDGVALGTGKSYIPILADETGPTFDDVLEFDFLSPDTFTVDGIAANPTVNLTFQLFENDAWISIGDSRYPLPKGNSQVWNLDQWELEHVFADASYRQYQNHRAGCDLCGGSGSGALLYEALGIDEAEIVVGRHGYDNDPLFGPADQNAEHFPYIDPNPAGWMRIWTLFGLGSPPEPQYVWDMILEVAERRLLDGGVAQGEGDVSFPLYDIPVGLTADEIKDATRPILQSQKSLLSSLLLGDYQETALSLDFYLAKGDDGTLRLYFVDPSDPVPTGTATHAKPGFYSDEALTQKVSTTADGGSGDTVHDKLELSAQQTVYCQDADGTLFRIQVEPAAGDEVTLTVRQFVGQ